MSKKYKEIVLELLWKKGNEGLIASQINNYITSRLGGDQISRTAISIFLNQLCKDDVVTYREETCRGGIRRKYFLKKTKEEYEKDIVRNILLEIVKSQPKQAAEALIEILTDNQYYSNFSWNILNFLVNRNEIINTPLQQTFEDLGNPISL